MEYLFIITNNIIKVSLNKGKILFPKLYNFLIKNVIINEHLSYEQRKFLQINVNLNSSSEYIENFEYEAKHFKIILLIYLYIKR